MENGLAYDIVNQLANLLNSYDPNNPLPAAYRPDVVLHAGESQQAGSVVTFASGFHEPGLSDGYFIQSGFNARPINFGPVCGDPGDPGDPMATSASNLTAPMAVRLRRRSPRPSMSAAEKSMNTEP